MRPFAGSALILLLAASRVAAQPTPPVDNVSELLASSIESLTGEQSAALTALNQEMRDAEGNAREFHGYLIRMRSDARAQRTIVAVGNLHAYDLRRAASNWEEWKDVAELRLNQSNDLAESVADRRHEQEDRWALFAGQSPTDLSPEVQKSYQQAQATQKQMLAVLARLQELADNGKAEAQEGIDTCDNVLALLLRTQLKMRSDFYFQRVGFATFLNAPEDIKRDVEALVDASLESLGSDWRERFGRVMREDAQLVFFAVFLLVFFIWRVETSARRLGGELEKTRRSFAAGLVAVLLEGLRRMVVLGAITGAAWGFVIALGSATPVWLVGVADLLGAVLFWRFIVVFVGIVCVPGDQAHAIFDLSPAGAQMARSRVEVLAAWLLVGIVLSMVLRFLGVVSTPFMLLFLLLELLALSSVSRSLRDDRMQILNLSDVWRRRAKNSRSILHGAMILAIATAGLGFVNLAAFCAWALFKLSLLAVVGTAVWLAGARVIRRELTATTGTSVRVLWGATVMTVVIVLAPDIVGIRHYVVEQGSALLSAGFTTSGHEITVGHVIAAAFWVVAAAGLGRLTNSFIRNHLFPQSVVDAGVREAIATTTRYLLIAGGVLLGIRQLGFDLTSFAIVAGALSVGVGFGMQTLVSNFVSGLIILYERPIRRGDIVEQEGVMGSVKKIRTRSTLMQTFDEAELVVPNAELLSKRITNWTLTNYRSRVVIPIAVAYGSDVELVRDALLEVAAKEPRLMDEPRVFFAAFGDSSLKFQLVVRVDIRERMEVVSDLHFAIDKVFREKGIKIPHAAVVT